MRVQYISDERQSWVTKFVAKNDRTSQQSTIA